MLDRLKALMQAELLQKKNDAGHADSQQSIVARQPVFDRKGSIWGYELLYRRPQNVEYADISSGTVATASVIISGFETVRPSLKETQKVLINFTGDLIETQVATLLPPEHCIVEILEDVEPTPQVLSAVKAIKAAGYTVAVDDYIGQPSLQPFLPLADILKIDVLGMSHKEIADHVMRIRGEGLRCTLLAEKVEDQPTVALCQELGFSLFQGFFFSKPEVMHGKKISTSQALRMQLLALCVSDDVDIEALSNTVLHDPLITARLLKFVNSAHFGLREKIRTVRHALTLVGPLMFMQWLCVNVLATLENSLVSHDLAFLASQRAKFLECLGQQLAEARKLPPEVTVPALFLTGLFSLLESVTRMPLKEILDGVPLEEAVFTALTGGESPYSPWLTLMELHERGQWDESLVIAGRLGITENDLVRAYSKALDWSSIFFSTSQGKKQ